MRHDERGRLHVVVVLKKMEADHITIIVVTVGGVGGCGGGGEHITARSGSFTLMSILVSSKSLRSAKLARTVEAREHSRRWNLCFWFRDHGWVLMIHHICGGGGGGIRGLVPEIVNKLAGVCH